jgi:hypothetical protein
MSLGQWCVTSVLLCALPFAGCAHRPPDVAIEAKNDAEIQSLLSVPTPDHLAAASVLVLLFERQRKTDLSMELIERAEALAPLRPELVWMQLGHCRRLQCDAKSRIEEHLKELDPGNGFVWIPDLERAEASGSQASGSRMTIYSNELEVMLADGLAVADPSQSLVSRGEEAIGLVAAMAMPPLQPMSKACQAQQFDVPGRRAALVCSNAGGQLAVHSVKRS